MTYCSDTQPGTDQLVAELLRGLPSWKKHELLAGLNAAARELALLGLRQRHPGMTGEELHRRLADLVLGPELAAEAYGHLTGREIPE